MYEYFKLRRNVIAILLFLGVTNVYILRINLSVAIVDMTMDHITENPNGTTSHMKHFYWDSKQKGMILSAFFYGYILTQVAGGYLGSRYGGVTVFGISVGATAALTLLTPLCARIGIPALVALRTLEGIFEGLVFPCIKCIWSNWSPPGEMTRLSGISYSGVGVGSVITFSGCGLIADTLGWEYIFYISGSISLIWYLIWFLYVTNDPRDDPYIQKDELKCLKETLKNKEQKITYPWKQIITCPPVWAIVAAGICENWGGYTMLTQLPMYLKNRYNFDTSKSGFILTLPYILKSITIITTGVVADKLRKKSLNTTQVRKLFTCGAFIIEATFTTIVALVDSPIIAIICLTASVGLGSGSSLAGYGTNPLDLAPHYAGIILGIGNTFATISGIVCPNIAGYIVTDGTRSEWRLVFIISAGVYLIGVILYGIFASAVKQPWSEEEKPVNKEEEMKIYRPQEECP